MATTEQSLLLLGVAGGDENDHNVVNTVQISFALPRRAQCRIGGRLDPFLLPRDRSKWKLQLVEDWA